MRRPRLLFVASICFTLTLSVCAHGTEHARIAVTPAQVSLEGKDSSMQLLVTGYDAEDNPTDLTHLAKYSFSSGNVSVSRSGVVRSRKDGDGTVTVQFDKLRVVVPVKTSHTHARLTLNFENDIIPILSRYSCNTSGCHGKAEGQNGFKLSVFGFDPMADYQAIAMEGRGRRVFPGSPQASLLLRKMSGGTPHGGGIPISRSRPEYRTIRDWIAQGLPVGSEEDATIVSLEMTPRQRIFKMGETQQLRAMATLSDGRQVDVTELTQFQTNSPNQAVVDAVGHVTAGQSPGTAAVMATYMGQVDVLHVFVPREEPIQSFPRSRQLNFIDDHVLNNLKKLNILPSGDCDDEQFLRRVYIDMIGTLPTAQEARGFLASNELNKREQLIDQLLIRDEFSTYWALKWSDLLRVDRLALGHENAYLYYNWIRRSFQQNKPLNQFARELLVAEGPLRESPAGLFYKAVPATKRASTFSQVFLGVRIECAECHHHPYDRWGQKDYFGMQAFFAQLQYKTSKAGEVLLTSGNPVTKHPRTGESVNAYALGTEMPEQAPEGDRRLVLAEWMTATENPWFARNVANRTWAHFMGRGIVEPVDDVRLTNPPTNPALLEALSNHFVESEFDFRQLVKTILMSATYQRSPEVNPTNERDEQNYSRYLFKQLEAEVMLDAISQVTGRPEKFEGVPAGSRAIELWDSSVPNYFLKVFGRPVRATACECERVSEPTVSQVLHVLNSPAIQKKLNHQDGRIRAIATQFADNKKAIEEIYLTCFARYPEKKELEVAVGHLENSDDRQLALEDVAWSMMNSLEFLFNH
ncbi:DUF1553 domain-containing protein [Pirellulaceae bacterium]|nr:DUF1553 domain-containing protein [Pirellulaceae bacterium]